MDLLFDDLFCPCLLVSHVNRQLPALTVEAKPAVPELEELEELDGPACFPFDGVGFLEALPFGTFGTAGIF